MLNRGGTLLRYLLPENQGNFSIRKQKKVTRDGINYTTMDIVRVSFICGGDGHYFNINR